MMIEIDALIQILHNRMRLIALRCYKQA